MIGRLGPRTHDPEAGAARYLSGEYRRWARRRFEDHLVSCDECWREVALARRGRAVAEAAREIAPPGLRDRVRGAVSITPAPRRRIGALLAPVAAVLALAVAAGALVLARAQVQPEAIAAALASYRSERPPSGTASRPAPDLTGAGLRPAAAGRTRLGEVAVDVFVYRGAAGRVLVYITDSRFPEARGAMERTGDVEGWRAESGGTWLVCADEPVSYLLVSESRDLVDRAEAALRRAVAFAGGG